MNRKKWIAAGMILVMGASMLAGCRKKETVESLVKKMTEAAAEKSCMEIDWSLGMDMDMTMKLLGEMNFGIGMEMEANTQMVVENSLSFTRASVKVNAMDEEQTVDMDIYTEAEDEKNITTYVSVEDQWMKTTTEIPEGITSNTSVIQLADLQQYFTLQEETAQRDEITCYQLDAVIPAEELLPKVAQLTSAVQAETDTDLSVLEGKNFAYTVYVNKDTFLPEEMLFELADDAGDGSEGTEAAEDATEAEAGDDAEDMSAPEDTEEEEELLPGEEEDFEEETGDSEEEANSEEANNEEDLTGDLSDMVTYDFSRFSMIMHFSYPESVTVEIPEEARNGVDLEGSLNSLIGEEEEEGSMEEGSQFEKLEAPEVIKEYTAEDPDALILNEKDVSMRLVKIYREGTDYYVDMDITNNTDTTVELYSEAAAVNHIMTDGSFFCDVESGKTKTACLYLTNLEELGIQEIKSLVLVISGSDYKTYDTFIATGPIEITVAEGEEAPVPMEGGSQVYEDDHLSVTAYPETEEAYSKKIRLCLIGKDDKPISISNGTVTVGGKEIMAFAYGYLLPDCITYADLEFDLDTLETEEIEELKDVKFTLTGTDLSTYEEVYTSGEIAIP